MEATQRRVLDMTGYQWTVLLAAWLGWGFDVAPNCVPTLLHLPLGTPEAKAATLQWTGILTSLLLVGWGLGGIVFGRVADRIGRTKTLLLTMLLYALGTAACAVAPNIGVLALFRFIASLGIGGEWAAGASMVAEVVPERRRVEAGALLYSSAPMGLFLAAYVTRYVQGHLFAAQPEVAWRYVFLFGLLPAAVAFAVRIFVKEPERWRTAAEAASPPKIADLFAPPYRKITLSGLGMAVVALITWWSCNAFIPTVAAGLASGEAAARGLVDKAATNFVETWKQAGSNWFNLGGLKGHVRHLLRRFWRRDHGDVRSRDAAGNAAVDELLHRAYGLRRFRELHLLPARALSHPAPRHRRGLLLQRGALRRRSRAVPRRLCRLARQGHTAYGDEPLVLGRSRAPCGTDPAALGGRDSEPSLGRLR